MINNPGVAQILATGNILAYDAVTLKVSRGRVTKFANYVDWHGVHPSELFPIVDAVRWTSAPRPLSIRHPSDPESYTYQPLVGASYQRGRLKSKLGREVMQIDMSVAGSLPILLSTACDDSGNLSGQFPTSLMDLCVLGLLDGAQVIIDQVVMEGGQLPTIGPFGGPGVVSSWPVRKFAGIVRRAIPAAGSVSLECCDPMILGGGSVPTGVFSPSCQWDFCDGRCPVARNIGTLATGTHVAVAGSAIHFLDSSTVRVPHGIFDTTALPWGFLVPQDGPMMGMRFQLGAMVTGDLSTTTLQFADVLPWAWDCQVAHLELSCSKLLRNQTSIAQPRACADWNAFPSIGALPSSIYRFSGCPDMPQPEGA